MKTKRIASLLLALVLAFALLPTTALATARLGNIEVTMTKPTIGNPLPTDAKLTSTSKAQVTSVKWSPESPDGTMQYDTAYTVTITLEITPGADAVFPNAASFVAKINGSSSGVTKKVVNDTKITLTRTYDAYYSAATTEAAIINKIDITMSTPEYGQPLPTDAHTGSNSYSEVTRVVWTGQSDNGRAIAGVTNPVTIGVRIKPGMNAKYTTKTLYGYVNGSNILLDAKRLSDSEAEITFVFPALGINFPGMKSGFTAKSYKSQTYIAEQVKRNLAETVVSNTFSTAPSYKAPYAAGKLGSGVRALTSNRLNLLRSLAGVNYVTENEDLMEESQTAAVMLAAPSGTFGKPSGMSDKFYKTATNALQWSNYYAGSGSDLQTAHAMDMMIEGSGIVSRGGGSRVWMLMPQMKLIGFGYAVSENRQYVVADCRDYGGDFGYYDFVSWPASGNFPNNLDAFTASTEWSVHLNPEQYAAAARKDLTITLTRASDGRVWTFNNSDKTTGEKYLNVNQIKHFSCRSSPFDYSSIYFRPDGIDRYEGTYTVRIEGLKYTAGTPAVIEYTVVFFDINDPHDEPITPTLTPAIPTSGTAYNSTVSVKLDRQSKSFRMYALKDENGNLTNYVRVRDLASALNGTPAQFDVEWDGTAVNLVRGKAYTANGTSSTTPFRGQDRGYTALTTSTKVNGSPVNLQGIVLTDDNGGDYTYYQLRDLARQLNFDLQWKAGQGIVIDTEPISG